MDLGLSSGDNNTQNISELCKEFDTINKILNLGIMLRERNIKEPIWLKKDANKKNSDGTGSKEKKYIDLADT